jgi:RNA-binding protein
MTFGIGHAPLYRAPMDTRMRKRLRQIAHHLDPIVTVGDGGLSEGLVGEAGRALGDHELIKVRLSTASRGERADQIDTLAMQLGAQVVQTIGKVAVLYRGNPEADPKLSNLHRFAR